MSRLPILPLPCLETTYKELLTWIKPLLTKDEFIQTKKEIEPFFRKNAAGYQLQEKLKNWKVQHKSNWLAPLWNDLYLTHRGKVQTDLNYHCIMDDEKFSDVENKPQFTARFLLNMIDFYHLIVDDVLYSEAIIPDSISDDQYANLFKATRIPHKNKDSFLVGNKDKRNNYVVMIHKGNFYPLYLTDDTGKLIDELNLIQAINTILMNNPNNNEASIGYLTTATRDDAARIYKELNEDKHNQENFTIINNALAMIHFDDDSEDSLAALERLFLNGVDKYYDKTLQFSITNDYKVGVSVEHTAIDATTILTLFEYITANFNNKRHTDPIAIQSSPIQALQWHVSQSLLEKIQVLKTQNKAELNDYILLEKTVNTVGTDQIKQAKFSPDAFFHMALQIAAYSTFGHMQNTYEAVAMLTYQQGRTECNRPATSETLALAKYYLTEAATHKNMISLMHEAHDEHRRRIKNCVTGNGVERHLFGLEKMYEKYGDELGFTSKPSLFDSTGYKKLKHDVLSTTNISHPLVSHFTFGPVVENGYGIYYALLPNAININISAQSENKEHVAQLLKTFDSVAKDLLHIADQYKDEVSS